MLQQRNVLENDKGAWWREKTKVMSVYKGEEDSGDRSRYKSISLKLYELRNNKHWKQTELHLGGTQNGYQRDRGTIDLIFGFREIAYTRMYNIGVNIAFVVLQKAFG